jgi:acetylornithine deacetylase
VPEIVPLLQRLVAIDSTSSRSNLPVLDLLEAEARGRGFETRRMAWRDDAGVEKGNLVCRRGPEGPGGLALFGHTDCVPFDPEWKEALAAEVRDGRLVGRGAADTKAFLAAALVASEQVRTQRLPLTLIFTADEEVGCVGAKHAAEDAALRPSHAIVGEPTSLTPIRAHKGYCAVEVEITGQEGHSAYPAVGASAIRAFARLWPDLERIGAQLSRAQDAAFDPPYATWNVGLVSGGKARNVIPGSCRFTYEWRPLPGQDPRAALRLLEEACARAEADGEGHISLRITPMRTDAGAVTRADAGIVRFLEAESGNRAATVPFGTELPEAIAMGAEGCVFGPGDIRVAHRTGEYVEVAELEKAAVILAKAIERYCG